MARTSSLFFTLSVKFEFGGVQRAKLYTKLYQLLENGVALDIALKQIASIAQKRGSKTTQELYRRWHINIANGMNLGLCLAPYAPNAEAMLIETGANTGRLAQSLKTAADSIAQQQKVKKAIVSSAAYPCVLIVMLIAAMILSSYMIIPTFAEILPVEKWTGISYGVAMVAEFLRNYSLPVFGSLAFLLFIIFFTLPSWTSRLRVAFDQYPPWSIYRIWQGSSFLLAVSSMMASGVKIDEVSLGRLANQANPYLKQRIRGLTKYITAGDNLGEAFFKAGHNFPDEELISDLQIYANLRGFDDNLIRITQTWVDSLVEQVTIIMKIFNVAVLFLIAIVIGCLIYSFYDLFEQIQSQTEV